MTGRLGPAVVQDAITEGWHAVDDSGEWIGVFHTQAAAMVAYQVWQRAETAYQNWCCADDEQAETAARAWTEAEFAALRQARASRKARPSRAYRQEFALLRRTLSRLRSERT